MLFIGQWSFEMIYYQILFHIHINFIILEDLENASPYFFTFLVVVYAI